MTIKLQDEIVELLRDRETVKILATVDEKGFPHAVVKQSLQLDENGHLLHLEFLESSRTNKNLVRSIWYDRKVSVTLKGKGDLSYQIKGRPIKSIISGPFFKKHCVEARERLGDVGLATIWIIEPEEVINESFAVRLAAEEAVQVFSKHLDRIAAGSGAQS